MDRRICVIYLEKGKNGLYRTSNNINGAMLRALMKKYNIDSFQYVEDELPSVMECADDILATIDDDLVYIVNEENVQLSMAIAHEINQLEEINQYFIIESDIPFEIKIEDVKVLSGDYEQEILNLLDVDVKLDTHKVEGGIEVYSNNIVSMEKAGEVGVYIGRKKKDTYMYRDVDEIYKEIDEINKRYEGINALRIPLLTMEINQHPNYKEIINKLLTQYSQFSFEMLIAIDEVGNFINNSDNGRLFFKLDIKTEDDIKKLISIKRPQNISSIRCNHGLIRKSVQDFKKMMKYVVKNDIDTSFYCTDLRDYWIEYLGNELKEFINDNHSENYNALSLGFTISQTCEYVGVSLVGSTKHIVLDKAQVSVENLLKLNEFCSINSALHIYDAEGEKSTKLVDKYHFNRIGEVIRYDAFQNEKKEILMQHHMLPINMVTFSEGMPINVNGITNATGKKYHLMPYSQVDIKKKIDKEYMITLTLEKIEDLDKLLEDAEIFRETNKIAHSPLQYYNLQNVCRFMSRNYCQVEELPHFRVDQEGEIYPCIDNAISVGNMQEAYFDIKQNTYMYYEKEISRRQCTTCSAVAICTRCAYLPDFMKERFCDIMKTKNYVSDFVIESKVLPGIIRSCKGYEKVKIEDINISNEYMFLYTKGEEYGKEVPYFAKYVFLTECKGMHTIWSPVTNKVYKISKEIFIIAECLLRRWKLEDINNYLVKELNLEKSIIEQVCDIAYTKFFEYNLLHRPIK